MLGNKTSCTMQIKHLVATHFIVQLRENVQPKAVRETTLMPHFYCPTHLKIKLHWHKDNFAGSGKDAEQGKPKTFNPLLRSRAIY